jgi:hypothetical protein
MGKTIRNSGFVALGAGVIIILGSYAGYVILEGFDRFEAHLKLYDLRTYIALVPGIVMISLGWVIVRYQLDRLPPKHAARDAQRDG